MCGIVGYVGSENCIDVLHRGLQNLEYRGYDSAGISYIKKSKIITKKSVGKVKNLFDTLDENDFGHIGIGHTRWATHGIVSQNNCHPQNSFENKISLVHNGIIENYMNLKTAFFADKEFTSETDTEIVANLLEMAIYNKQLFDLKLQNYLNQNKIKEKCFFTQNITNSIKHDNLQAINTVTKLLKGSFAIAFLVENDKHSLYFAKNISPLVVGHKNNNFCIASDLIGICEFSSKFVDIDDGWFGYIDTNGISIFDKNGKTVNFTEKDIPPMQDNIKKCGYDHFMLKEIFEIPTTIDFIANYYGNLNLQKYKATKNPLTSIKTNFFDNVDKITFVACGTSYHAGKFGELLIKSYNIDATTELASEFIYTKQKFSKNNLFVFISQSGETADTLTAARIIKKHRLKSIAITNVETSSLTKICNFVLPIKCGPEIAVASTKAYNAQISVILLLSVFLKQIFKSKTKNFKNIEKNTKNIQNLAKNIGIYAKKLKKLAENINITNLVEQTKIIIPEVLKAKKVLMLGKHFDYVTALESALKLKEITYLSSEAYPSGELKHGTIALVDSETLVFAFISEKNLINKTTNIINQVKSRGAKIVVITPFEYIKNTIGSAIFVDLPKVDELLYPLISIIPMQLVAYQTSIGLGYDPDKPRNLAKSVTVE